MSSLENYIHFYSFIYNGNNKYDYYLFYITNKYEKLEGISLKLNPKLKSRFLLTMEFANQIYDEYSEDTTTNLYIDLERLQFRLLKNIDYKIIPEDLYHPYIWEYKRDYSNDIDGKTQFVYLIKNINNGLVKIGRTKTPLKRENTLQSTEPEIHMVTFKKAPKSIETELHRKFKLKRFRGEWFKLDYDDLRVIEKYIVDNR